MSVPAKYSLPQAFRASNFEHSLEVCKKGPAGCPPFGGHRTVSSARTEENAEHLPKHLLLSIEVQSFGSVSLRPSRKLEHSAVTKLQVQFKLRSGSLRIQRWYASAPKYKARLRVHERGLTLPSSGPAYGRPLKSNVRRRLTYPFAISAGGSM